MKEENIIETLNSLGFNTEGKSFIRCVELLVHEHIRVLSEIEIDNKEYFKRELRKISTTPTN